MEFLELEHQKKDDLTSFRIYKLSGIPCTLDESSLLGLARNVSESFLSWCWGLFGLRGEFPQGIFLNPPCRVLKRLQDTLKCNFHNYHTNPLQKICLPSFLRLSKPHLNESKDQNLG